MFDNFLFVLSAVLTMGGALAVVLNRNLMHSCIFLLASLFGVAGLYATLNADFLAATQLVVYAGGVVILMLFAVMLTGGNVDDKSSTNIFRAPAMGNVKTYIFGGLTATVMSLVVYKIVANGLENYTPKNMEEFSPTVERIGELLLTDHVLAFEISSVLLLGALIGASVIARPKGH